MMDIGKDLQDAYEHGRQDALTELMEYTYGMLTAEKFGLQHKIKSMMTDRCFHKTESDSEKPNNCEDDEYWEHLFIEVVKGHMSDAAANQAWLEYINHKDEPTISKMEQVDKDINVRSKTEPQNCDTCRHHFGKDFDIECEVKAFGNECRYEPKTEPSGYNLKPVENEPQTESE